MHTSHLLDFNTINTNVSLSRTLILKEAIHFPSCEYNINKRKQGPVPQNVGELALDILFLISLKIKLSFIPMHVHACTLLLMAQPKVNLLNKNEGSNPPNSFFELPSLLSFISPGKKGIKCLTSGTLLSITKTQHFPILHPSKSRSRHWVLTAAHHTPAKGSQPACSCPSCHSPLRRGKSSVVESTKKSFPRY